MNAWRLEVEMAPQDSRYLSNSKTEVRTCALRVIYMLKCSLFGSTLVKPLEAGHLDSALDQPKLMISFVVVEGLVE